MRNISSLCRSLGKAQVFFVALSFGILSQADELIVNGDFESGAFAPWQVDDSANFGVVETVINDGTGVGFSGPDGVAGLAPCGGGFSAIMRQLAGGQGIQQLYQQVTLPSALVSATLSWTDQIRNHNRPGAAGGLCAIFGSSGFVDPNQEIRVYVADTSGAVLRTLYSTDPTDPVLLKGCESRTADLIDFRGQTVRIVFEQQNGICFQNLQVDDVSLEVELLLAPPNRNPTLSAVADQTLFGSTVLGPIEFTIADGQTAPSLLKVVASSDNPSVVLNQNILLGGAGAKRNLLITGINGFGTSANVTIQVVDESGGIGQTRFSVTSFSGHSIVIDNLDGQFSSVGDWRESGTVDEYLGSSLFASTGGSQASFTPATIDPGSYKIFAWWANKLSSGFSVLRSPSVGYQVNHSGQTDTVSINQTIESGRWIELGTFAFDGRGGENVIVEVPLDGASQSVSADGIAFVAVSGGGSMRDIVVDNLDEGFLSVGNWTESGSTDEFMESSLATFSSSDSAIWSPTLSIAGNYQVFVWVTRAIRDGRLISRAESVKYILLHGGAMSQVVLDQNAVLSGTWTPLGSYFFNGEGGENVTLLANGAGFGTGSASADAVRFLLQNESTVPDIIVDNLDPGFSVVGNWSESGALDEFNGSSVFSQNSNDRAMWSFPKGDAGSYQVLVWNSASLSGGRRITRNTAARYIIVGAGVSSVLTLDQNDQTGKWLSIGEFEFSGDGAEGVSVFSGGNSTVADAVRFVKTN